MPDSGSVIRLRAPTWTLDDVAQDDLAQRVQVDGDLLVTNAETGEDTTRSVLKQIIVERKCHG
jgi:polyhydroxyalkanoate synthesis regulator protein